MEQKCENCLHFNKEGNEEPCVSCMDITTWSNFTPKKDINQVLREKLGYVVTAQPEEPKIDMVKQPSHYMLKPGLEVRDVLTILVNKIREGSQIPYWKEAPMFESDYVQAMQYGMRFMDKGGKQDLEKMRWYLDKLIEAYE